LALLQGADALLDPIRWPEPFGLVMAEAMAAGVPVLAYPSGAAPEIVRPGLTGFLCADEDAMVAAVGRIDLIDRDLCRTTAERYFGSDRMAAEYEVLYEHAIEGRVATEWFGDQFAARPSLAARAGPSGREHSL
jgi:glycosyltransferase involved in cell wall biosynthesis